MISVHQVEDIMGGVWMGISDDSCSIRRAVCYFGIEMLVLRIISKSEAAFLYLDPLVL